MRVGAERFMQVFNEVIVVRGFEKDRAYPYPMRDKPVFFKINNVISCSVMYAPKEFYLSFYINEQEHEAYGDGFVRYNLDRMVREKPRGNYTDMDDVAKEGNILLDEILDLYETKGKETLLRVVRYQMKKGRKTDIFYDDESIKLISTLDLDLEEFNNLYDRTNNDLFLPKSAKDIFVF